jgi:hypothetical protein
MIWFAAGSRFVTTLNEIFRRFGSAGGVERSLSVSAVDSTSVIASVVVDVDEVDVVVGGAVMLVEVLDDVLVLDDVEAGAVELVVVVDVDVVVGPVVSVVLDVDEVLDDVA